MCHRVTGTLLKKLQLWVGRVGMSESVRFMYVDGVFMCIMSYV